MNKEAARTAARLAQNTPIAATAVQEYHKAIREVAVVGATEIVNELNKHAMKSVKRMGELVESADQQVAFRAAAFTIDHMIGKATQKSLNRTEIINIDVLAS